MKRNIPHFLRPFLMILSVCFLLSACTSEPRSETPKEQNEIWKLAKEGKMKGVEVPLGVTKTEALAKLSNPKNSWRSEFGYRLDYEGFSLEFGADGVVKSLDELDDKSTVMTIYAKPETVGWTGTTNDVKKMFGTPDHEFNDEAYGPAWNQTYKVGSHLLTFIAETEGGPIIRIRL